MLASRNNSLDAVLTCPPLKPRSPLSQPIHQHNQQTEYHQKSSSTLATAKNLHKQVKSYALNKSPKLHTKAGFAEFSLCKIAKGQTKGRIMLRLWINKPPEINPDSLQADLPMKEVTNHRTMFDKFLPHFINKVFQSLTFQ